MHSSLLSGSYIALAEEKKWQAYADSLASDGIRWVLSMNLPLLKCHLVPLSENIGEFILSPRLMFLMDLFSHTFPSGFFRDWYRTFFREKDVDAASAAAGAGLFYVWDSGRGYHRMKEWFRRIEDLFNHSPGDLASAALWGMKGMALCTGPERLPESESALQKAVGLAEKLSVGSLVVYCTSFLAYCCMKKGDIRQMAFILQSCRKKHPPECQPLICQTIFQIMEGWLALLTGKTRAAKHMFSQITALSNLDKISLNTWLLTQNLLLNAMLYHGDTRSVESVVSTIQHRAIPKRNHSNHAFVHYSQGLAALMRKEPGKALLYARHAQECLYQAQSPFPSGMNMLLEVQSLFDLERHPQAVSLMEALMPKWETQELGLLRMGGLLEMCRFSLSRDDENAAREYYERAARFWTGEPPMFWMNRPLSFIQELEMLLDKCSGRIKTHTTSTPLIYIKTFGKFEVRVKKQRLYDRNWRGKCSKRLLKALIALGGKKVSVKKLAASLWPDASPEKAVNAFRVSLYRLRHIGGDDFLSEWPWITVQNGEVSLNQKFVTVDAIQFREQMAIAQREMNLECLTQTLNLYEDDFLKDEADDVWIIRHRETLREKYVSGILSLDGQITGDVADRIIPYIETAIGKDPYNEALYAMLMRAYLQSGDKAGVVQAFNRAEAFLRENSGEGPGAVLISMAEKIRKAK